MSLGGVPENGRMGGRRQRSEPGRGRTSAQRRTDSGDGEEIIEEKGAAGRGTGSPNGCSAGVRPWEDGRGEVEVQKDAGRVERRGLAGE